MGQVHESPPASPAPAPAPPHVVMFPLPFQGHINAMLRLAELLTLCDPGVKITFLNSEHSHGRLLRCSDVASRFSGKPNFRFKTISDGLPQDSPRSEDQIPAILNHLELTAKDVIAEVSADAGGPPTCIIADGVLSFAIDAGEEIGAPVILFRTVSACCFWVYFWVPCLVEAGELPIRGNEDMDRIITCVPGMEGLLRCRDLPGLCRVADPYDPLLQFVTSQTRQTTWARGLILNTFDTLDEPILDRIRAHCPNIYTVGPVHSHLECRLSTASQVRPTRHSSNTLLKEDRSCLQWLDKQPARSVVYVSFGSVTVLKAKELWEFWYGLVNSKYRFLWVMRPDSIQNHDHEVEPELRAATEERGCIVEWAPQEEVLTHPATGGFLTHSGWNSTMESIAAGVPMVCWPYFADQQINSRFVSEVWRVGLDMKDVCDRTVVERMINDLMVRKRDELAGSAATKAKMAAEAVSEGGSSWDNMNRLVQDIRRMHVRKQ